MKQRAFFQKNLVILLIVGLLSGSQQASAGDGFFEYFYGIKKVVLKLKKKLRKAKRAKRRAQRDAREAEFELQQCEDELAEGGGNDGW